MQVIALIIIPIGILKDAPIIAGVPAFMVFLTILVITMFFLMMSWSADKSEQSELLRTIP